MKDGVSLKHRKMSVCEFLTVMEISHAATALYELEPAQLASQLDQVSHWWPIARLMSTDSVGFGRLTHSS